MSGTRILVIALLSIGAAFGLAALNLRVFPAFWSERILDSAQVDDAQVFAPDSRSTVLDTGGAQQVVAASEHADSDRPSPADRKNSADSGDGSRLTESAALAFPLTAAEVAALLVPIIYQTGGAELSGSETMRLEALARYLKGEPQRRLLITGYSTPSGGMRYNRFIASQRARVVRNRLQGLGVPRRQLVTDGHVYTQEEQVQMKRSGNNPRRAELSWFEK